MVSSMKVVFSVIFYFIWGFYGVSTVEDEFEDMSTLAVEHTFDAGNDALFTRRGTVSIKSVRSGVAQYSQETPLTEEDKENLKKLVQNDGYYRLRVPVKNKLPDGVTSVSYVSTFVKACLLYESRLADEITLNIDQSGNLLAVALLTDQSQCLGLNIPQSQINSFKTKVNIIETATGPVPETQIYVERMEKEKAQQKKGQQDDNRSFFAKYWMYLVPVVIFVMMSGAGGEQGGSGR